MDLRTAKNKITEIESQLAEAPFLAFGSFTRDGRVLHVSLTERLRRRCRKVGVWKSKEFLTALKNVEYGIDEKRLRSRSGLDGIFLLDRDFKPENEMIRKLFDRYIDKPHSGVNEVAKSLGVKADSLIGVRVVSHHMRLLGVLSRGENKDWLVLVDFDNTK